MTIRHSVISVRHSGTALGLYEAAAVMQDERDALQGQGQRTVYGIDVAITEKAAIGAYHSSSGESIWIALQVYARSTWSSPCVVFREFDAIPSRIVSVCTSGDIWNIKHQTPGSHRPPSPTHETSLLREPFEHRQFVKTTRWPHPPIYHSCIWDKPNILTCFPLDEFRLVAARLQ
jgi:hypothetical protein